jgi:proteic killer suppression protein
MIRSFADKRTEAVYNEEKPQGIPADILKRALVKLQLINASGDINDLRIPPSNRLEKLLGDRAGYWSIRINNQWRIVFGWSEANDAFDVEIVDYH